MRETSLAALRAIKRGPLRTRVLSIIHSTGEVGAISEEIQRHFTGEGRADSSINARYSELEARGLIVGSGTRPNSGGRQQTVWRSSEFADQPAQASLI